VRLHRGQRRGARLRRDKVSHKHFHTPTILPILGALSCGFLVGPWTGRANGQYTIVGILLAIGVALWVVTVMINRAAGVTPAEPDVELGTRGPVN
jgi:hypothetical protein